MNGLATDSMAVSECARDPPCRENCSDRSGLKSKGCGHAMKRVYSHHGSMPCGRDSEANQRCQCHPSAAESREFRKRWFLLTDHERASSLRANFDQFVQTVAEILPCLGCRSSTETLYQKLTDGSTRPSNQVVNAGLCFENDKTFRLNDAYMSDSDASLSLFLHQERWAYSCLNKLTKNGKSATRGRCSLHTQRSRSRPRPAVFEAMWNKLSPEQQKHLSHIDSDQFLTDLENYLRRHRFCCRCKEKVLEAYDLLIGSSCSEDECEDCAGYDCGDKSHSDHASDYSDDLQYTSYLFDELSYSRTTNHIVVPCQLDFLSQLMSRADQEMVGDWGDRHARTIAEAQDEVLTCLGMVIWDKMQALWTKLKSEKRSDELLVHCAISTIRKNFDIAVEALHGQEMMEQLLAEEDDETRRLAKKKEKRKEKKKKRKNAKAKQTDRCTTEQSGREGNILRGPSSECSTDQVGSSSTEVINQSDSNDDPEDDSSSSSPLYHGSSSSPTEDDRMALDEKAEMQLLSLMGWNGSNQFSLSLQLEEDNIPHDEPGIPQDEIEFWKQNKSSLASKRLAQRQKLQARFDEFVSRSNSLNDNQISSKC